MGLSALHDRLITEQMNLGTICVYTVAEGRERRRDKPVFSLSLPLTMPVKKLIAYRLSRSDFDFKVI